MTGNTVLVAVPLPAHSPLSWMWCLSFADFWHRLPAGSGAVRVKGFAIDRARERAALLALESGFDWLFFLDSDVIAPPDAFDKLSGHGRDIVSGLVIDRSFRPLAMNLTPDPANPRKALVTHVDVPPETGLVEIDATGAGCLLIRTEAFRQIERPWFRYGNDSLLDLSKLTEGDLLGAHGEDIYFSQKAKRSGLHLFLDPGVRCAHEVDAAITPYPVLKGIVLKDVRSPGINLDLTETHESDYFPRLRQEAP
jgi:hypothetical protein